jgi:hypothetical protein
MVFDLGEPADYAAASAAANQIRGALVAITKAFIRESRLTELVETSALRPTDESADCFEEAVVTVYLVDANEEKLHTVRVPAPETALFLSDGMTVDTGNALLIQYVQQLAQHSFVSDGDVIDDANNNGIYKGYKRSKARKFQA